MAQVLRELPSVTDPNLLVGADHFDDAGVYEGRNAGPQAVKDLCFAIDEVEHYEVFGVEQGQRLLPNLLQEPEKLLILNVAVQCETDLIVVAVRKVRQGLAFPDAALEHEIYPLPSTFDEATLAKGLGQTSVAG